MLGVPERVGGGVTILEGECMYDLELRLLTADCVLAAAVADEEQDLFTARLDRERDLERETGNFDFLPSHHTMKQ